MKQEQNYTEKSFFFDSYALYEIVNGKSTYEKYLIYEIITSKLNIFELYHGFLKDGKEELAKVSVDKYYPFAVDYSKEVIVEAAKMKKELNKRDVSMADCIGYILARSLGIKFLTGDKEFENLNNVEFVK